MKVAYETIEGINVAYAVNDGGLERGRPTLLCIHGSGGDHHVWSAQFEGLGNRYNIVALDLPGHGRSEGEGDRTIACSVSRVRNLVEGLGLERPVVTGHSLGAAVALSYGLEHGGDAAAVIAVGGGAVMPVSPMVFEGIRGDYSSFIAFAPELALAKENRESLRDILIEGFSRVPPDVLYNDFQACDGFDITNDLHRIEIPVLVICGDADKMMPPRFSRFLHESISGSCLSILPGCGHFPMLEDPAAFNAAVTEFVEDISRGLSGRG
ncbi:MAG: alpha/beta hydrolase [Deltaproteobacteria bacterium]|nr:alpha/beta hydrolase [Deltaproteobacteria bacterium]